MSIASSKHTLSVNEFDMHYEMLGDGPPLLLLHGFTGSGAKLVTVFETLSATHQLIIPDLRGHGRSTNPSKKFSFQQAAADHLALLEHLNIQSCAAVGFSGGGCTLLQMASLKPEKINAMAIVSAVPYFPSQTYEIMRQFKIADRTEEEWQAMRVIHHHGDEQIRLLWEQVSALSNDDDMHLTTEKLAKIKAPTLIMQGDRDHLYPIELTIEMYKHIPNAYLWIVPNGGHVPLTENLMESFLAYLRNILKI